MNLLFYFLTIVICIILQGFFAAAEIAFLSCDRVKIRHLADRHHRRAAWVEHFLRKPVNYLCTTMIGVNVAVVVSASISAHVASFFFNDHLAPVVATLFLWPLILLFGEFIPMNLALAHPLRIALWGIVALKIVFYICYPFVWLITHLSDFINKGFGGKGDISTPYFTREELRLLFKGAQKDVFDKGHERIIRGIFDFHKVRAQDIMVPLKGVVSCPNDINVGQLKKIIFDSAYSRIPIYQTYPQYIVGIVHSSDLIGLEDDSPVESIMKTVPKVVQSKPAAEVLKDLGVNKSHAALVMDTRDRCVGLVTMEDILEEIVGEIEDEYDK